MIGILGCNLRPNQYFTLLYKIGAYAIGVNASVGVLWFLTLMLVYLTHTELASIWYMIVFVLVAIALNIWGTYSSFRSVITTYKVPIRKKHTWHKKKIIMIGDTHYGNIYGAKEARELVATINTLGWDILIIPGDFFDGPKIDFAAIANEFLHINTTHGILFANGNHEEYRNREAMLLALEKANIRILNNKKMTIEGMVFAGVTYHTTESQEGLKNTLDTLTLVQEDPIILLKHKPTLYTTLKEYPVDLVVSGHTHHGQMWPFSLITRSLYGRFSYGMTRLGMLTAITTSGVGTWGPPQRIGTRSEIVVIEIV